MKSAKVFCLIMSQALLGCAALPARTTAAKVDPPQPGKSVTDSGVRVVQLETPATEGQTTWKIEPSTPWLPGKSGHIHGNSPHIQQRLRGAFDLGQRGATYSAHEEFIAVLALCALEQDVYTGSHVHRDAMRQALMALDEADDFTLRRTDIAQQIDVPTIAASHSTRQYLEQRRHETDATSAVQAYFVFAEERLKFACGSLPAASAALYGLGRIEPLLNDDQSLASARAVLFHRVALAIDPSNTLAANELGVLLAQHGQLVEAERVLQDALALGESTTSLQQNLAAVRTMLGKDAPTGLQPMGSYGVTEQQTADSGRQYVPSSPPASTLADVRMNENNHSAETVTPSEHVSSLATESGETRTAQSGWKRLPDITRVFRR
jgi:hypothetical protein